MRVGDKVWYCKKLEQPSEDGQLFAEPKEIQTAFGYFTVMSSSGHTSVLQFGKDIKDYLTVIAQPYGLWFDRFDYGDLFYCNGAKPSETEEYYGQKANYVVDDINFGNIRMKLTLKRIIE